MTAVDLDKKVCTICKIEKPLSEYHNTKYTKNGKTSSCGKCNCERSRKYHLENKASISIKSKKYRKKNRDYFNRKSNEWNKKTGYISAYQKERLKKDPFFKFKHRLRTLIRNSITKKGYTKRSKSFQILGCTHEEFIKYIESKFKEGMSWSNHGKWHLDHIVPISSAKTEQDVISLNHYTNFQPLWAKDNLKKYNHAASNSDL